MSGKGVEWYVVTARAGRKLRSDRLKIPQTTTFSFLHSNLKNTCTLMPFPLSPLQIFVVRVGGLLFSLSCSFFFSSSPPAVPESPDRISVRILDKPHGNDGKWRVIQDGSRVRIPIRGKPVSVEVTAHPDLGQIDPERIQLELINAETEEILPPDITERGPWMHNAKKCQPKSTDSTQYLGVKIFIVRTTLYFRVTLKRPESDIIGTSPSFFVSNTGIPNPEAHNKEIENVDSGTSKDPEVELPTEVARKSLPTAVELQTFPTEFSEFRIRDNVYIQGQVNASGCILSPFTLGIRSFFPFPLLFFDSAFRSFLFLDFVFSDERLKYHIAELSTVSETLASLTGKSFRWRSEQPEEIDTADIQFEPNVKKVLGFIAQDLQRTLPEIVHETDDGWLTVEYTSVVPLIVEAIKLHSQELAKLRASAEELAKLNASYQGLAKVLKDTAATAALPPARGSSLPTKLADQTKRPIAKKGSSFVQLLRGLPPLQAALGSAGILLLIVVIVVGLGVGIHQASLATSSQSAPPLQAESPSIGSSPLAPPPRPFQSPSDPVVVSSSPASSPNTPLAPVPPYGSSPYQSPSGVGSPALPFTPSWLQSPAVGLRPPVVPPLSGPIWINGNFLGGGFEDPTNYLWTNDPQIMRYNESVQPAGPYLRGSAPFPTGEQFLFLNATTSLKSTSTSFNLYANGFINVYMSLWTYLLGPPLSTFNATIALTNTSMPQCFAFTRADTAITNKWQQLQIVMQCQTGIGMHNFRITLSAEDIGSRIAVDSVEASTYEGYILLAGQRDLSFGSQGVSLIAPPAAVGVGSISAMKFMSDGRIVVASVVPGGSFATVTVSRFLPDLRLDLSFGTVGSTRIVGLYQDPTFQSEGWLDIDAQNRTLVIGSVQLANGSRLAAAVRLDENGAMDYSFGGHDGFSVIVYVAGAQSTDECGGYIKSFPNGWIYVGLISRDPLNRRVVIDRLAENGSLDMSYPGLGIYGQTNFVGFDVDASGRTYLCSQIATDVYLYRLTNNGSLDTTYGSRASGSVISSARIVANFLSVFPVRPPFSFFMQNNRLQVLSLSRMVAL
jgi:hypothetical protein